MMGITEYIFHFDQNGNVVRIPSVKWNRVREGKEAVEEFASQAVYIAYAYILLENKTPDYCPRIDGAIYYFDETGKVISDQSYYFDLLQDIEEDNGGVVSLAHRKKKKAVADKYHWKLKPGQIQKVIDLIWP